MPPHSRKTAEGPPIEMSEYDETRATARLPNLDIEILHRRPWEGNEEHLMVTLRALPSFEAWTRMIGSNVVALDARAHHSTLFERQATIPARFRSGLSQPSRPLKEQDQRPP